MPVVLALPILGAAAVPAALLYLWGGEEAP
jgi:hypothetical protein